MSARGEIYGHSRAGSANLFKIGADNPATGRKVRCTWLRAWGGKPAGYTVTGKLAQTLAVNGGRTLIGLVSGHDGKSDLRLGARQYSCPWSRRFLSVELVK